MHPSTAGVDDNGKEYYPMVIVDGHISRTGNDVPAYVNGNTTQWESVPGALYGTNICQFHDDERLSGSFKMELSEEKRKWFLKKRVYGLPAKLLDQEVVLF